MPAPFHNGSAFFARHQTPEPTLALLTFRCPKRIRHSTSFAAETMLGKILEKIGVQPGP
jgi:hypothetical protein